jgi:hypothetical protein
MMTTKKNDKCETARTLNLGESASGGTGMKMPTLLAVDRALNCERALTRYSTRERSCDSTIASTQIRGLICVLRR